MASSRLGYLAIKIESTVATAVKPSHFLAYNDGDLGRKQEVIESGPIQNNRALPITPVKGKKTIEAKFKFDLDANECVYWLYGALGSLSSSDISSGTDGSVYEHTITVANSLPSWSVEQAKGNISDTTNNRQNYEVARAFGLLVDSLTVSSNDGIVQMEVNCKAHGIFEKADLVADASAGSSVAISVDTVEGLVATSDTVNTYDNLPQNEADAIASISTANKTITIATLGNSYTVARNAKIELTPQTPSYGTRRLFSFAHMDVQFGTDLTAAASASETGIENIEFSFMNNLEERFGSKRQTPTTVAPKGYKATLKFTRYFESIDERDKFLRLTKTAAILTLVNDTVISATDTNNKKYTVKIQISDLRLTSEEMPTENDGLYVVNVEGTCFYDASDGRAVRIIVDNSSAGTTYTA
jgi:hypothetical protein